MDSQELLSVIGFAIGVLIALGIYWIGQIVYTKGFEAGLKASRRK